MAAACSRVLGADLGPGIVRLGAVFAVGHFLTIRIPARLAVFFPALLFGWLRARTGGIGAGVVFHALCNVFSAALGRGLRALHDRSAARRALRHGPDAPSAPRRRALWVRYQRDVGEATGLRRAARRLLGPPVHVRRHRRGGGGRERPCGASRAGPGAVLAARCDDWFAATSSANHRRGSARRGAPPPQPGTPAIVTGASPYAARPLASASALSTSSPASSRSTRAAASPAASRRRSASGTARSSAPEARGRAGFRLEDATFYTDSTATCRSSSGSASRSREPGSAAPPPRRARAAGAWSVGHEPWRLSVISSLPSW